IRVLPAKRTTVRVCRNRKLRYEPIRCLRQQRARLVRCRAVSSLPLAPRLRIQRDRRSHRLNTREPLELTLLVLQRAELQPAAACIGGGQCSRAIGDVGRATRGTTLRFLRLRLAARDGNRGRREANGLAACPRSCGLACCGGVSLLPHDFRTEPRPT